MYMWRGDDALEELVLNVVTVLLDVLHLLIKFRVTHNKDGSLVVSIHWHRYLRDSTQILKKRLRPYNLISNVCHRVIY